MITLNGTPQTSMDLIRLILVNQMGLDPTKVNIYDEKWKIPPYDDLFIVVEYRNGKVIANRNTFVGATQTEVQDLAMYEDIVVGVFSRNREATQRKEEVLMAILSSYAESLQEKYSFKIARAGMIEDLSALEGSAMLKRYDIGLKVYAWYEKIITPGFIQPPFTVKVIANDPGTGEIINQFTQFLTQPTL